MTNDRYNAMEKYYLETIEDINATDKSKNIISKTFKGTGTLGQNDAYMLGLTSGVKLSEQLKKLLFEEVAKRQIIIDMFQDKVSWNLYKHSYLELLYMVAGAYNKEQQNDR